MAITDLTGYTWVGNETMIPDVIYDSLPDGISLSIISNNEPYDYIYVDWNTNSLVYRNTDARLEAIAFSAAQGWNSEYKTIEITGGTDATNATLITWLEANGTLTAPQPTGTPYINLKKPDGTKLQVDSAIRDGNGLKIDVGYQKLIKEIEVSVNSAGAFTLDEALTENVYIIKPEQTSYPPCLVAKGSDGHYYGSNHKLSAITPYVLTMDINGTSGTYSPTPYVVQSQLYNVYGIENQRDSTESYKLWVGTQAQYDAITTKNEYTIYYVKES